MHYLSRLAFLQNERGGAAVYSAGLVMFRGQAYFRGNGQYEVAGRYDWNPAGGAVTNTGSIEVKSCATNRFEGLSIVNVANLAWRCNLKNEFMYQVSSVLSWRETCPWQCNTVVDFSLLHMGMPWKCCQHAQLGWKIGR